jgi:D-alanyl-D-alanine carboxypeptidase
VPGLSVAVSRGDEIVFARGYGAADLERNVAARPDHVFRIGSVTKMFTAAAILRLVEEGRLSLDDPISRFIPEFRTGGPVVSVHHLLAHTSGIRNYTSMAEWRTQPDRPISHARMLEILAAAPPDFAPGEGVSYSNSGYYLLGMIVERASGRGYADYLSGEILAAVGPGEIHYCPDEPAVGHARGYTFAGAPSQPLSMTWPYAAGALCASAPALVRWLRALSTGEVVRPASFARMIRPDTLPDGRLAALGYGLRSSTWRGVRRVSHGGGIPGFNAYVAYVPEHELSVAVLQNTDRGNTEEVATRVIAALLD